MFVWLCLEKKQLLDTVMSGLVQRKTRSNDNEKKNKAAVRWTDAEELFQRLRKFYPLNWERCTQEESWNQESELGKTQHLEMK